MTQLEPLNIKITGSSEGLSSALARARQDTQGFGLGLGSISSKISGLFGSVATTLGPVGVVAAGALAGITAAAATAYVGVSKVVDQFAVIDDLADAANRLGVSLNELKGLRLAIGEATGLQGEQVDAAISKFQLNLSEAAITQTGKVYDRIRSLGLDARELIAEGPIGAIEAIASKVSELESPTDQLRVAFELFGKSGVGMVNALREGPDAIRETVQWAERALGLSDAQAEAIGRANDSWDRIGLLAETFFQVIAGEAAPAVEAILNFAIELADEFGGVQVVAAALVDSLAIAAGYAFDIAEFFTFSDAHFDTGEKFLAKIQELRDKAAAASESDETKFSDTDLAAFEAEERANEEAKKAAEKWAKKADALRDSLATPLEKYQKTLDELQQALDEGGLEWEYFARGVKQAGEDLAKARDVSLGPKSTQLLAASTDRADQIRRAAELRLADSRRDRERERAEHDKQMLATAREQRDLLKQLANEEVIEPAPINL